MFKKENIVWLYLVGIIIMIAIVVLVGKDYFIPVILGQRDRDIETGFVFRQPGSFEIDKAKDYRAKLKTDRGTITIDLFEKFAPVNVNNFIFLARRQYYDGTYFHRLVPGLFIQGGDRNTLNDDPSDDGFGGPGYILHDEINWDALNLNDAKRTSLAAAGYKSMPGVFSQKLTKFSVAVASSGPDTNGSQFFIVLADPGDPRIDEMNGKFTVIGEVIFGRDVLLDLANTPVDASNQLVPRPIRKLVITNVEITEN